MTSTTTTTVRCVYCSGIGTVYGGGAYAPRRQCLVCQGSGRIAPMICSECDGPMLDGQDRKWAGSVATHRVC